MKKKFYVIVYFLILISFPFIQKKFVPKQKLRKLEVNSEVKEYFIRKNNFDLHMDTELTREFTIGDTFFITDSLNKTFQITPIYTLSLRDLDFKTLSQNLPTLFIQSSEIKEVNSNNYAVGKINNDYFSQACLVNPNTYFFGDTNSYVHFYWETIYWLETFKNSLKNLIFNNSRGEACLLITSSDLDSFQEDINTIYNLIDFN